MTTLLVEDTRVTPQEARVAAAAETLEALVTRAWADLHHRGGTLCLACGSSMRALNATGGAGPIGHCAACGSELS
jgi:hypothetical protein